MTGPLSQASRKVQRSRHHITNLDTAIQAAKERARSPRVYYDLHRGKYVAAIETNVDREGFALVIGDAAHALSSALDYCWNVLARRSMDSKARETFPSHQNRANLEDAIRNSPLSRAFPQAVPLILETIRPYKEPNDGNYLVWAARGLDNIDKHNLLIPTLHVTDTGQFICASGEGDSRSTFGCAGNIHLEGNGRMELFASSEPIEVYQHMPIAFDIRFAEGQFFDGKAVVETLTDVADAVQEVVRLFIEAFPAP